MNENKETKTSTTKPQPDEYAPYYERYISRVPEPDVREALSSQIEETLALLRSIPEERGDYSYAPGKWTIKQVVGHICDTERVFAYRALRFARGDRTELAGFDQDAFVHASNFNARRLSDLIDEFESVRRASISLFQPLNDEEWSRRGVANDNPCSVRALARIIVGHERDHVESLRAKYEV